MNGMDAQEQTLRRICAKAAATLSAAGIEDAALDARLLLCAAAALSNTEYFLHCDELLSGWMDQETSETFRDRYAQLITNRSRHVPLQYLLGETEFMGLSFRTDPRGLIPRQDTETLVETILEEWPERETVVLDLCTGSGCVALSLAILGGYRTVVGTDLSADALQLAEENAARLLPGMDDQAHCRLQPDPAAGDQREPGDQSRPQRVRFLRADLFCGLPALLTPLAIGRFDVIVSNPPYIRSADIGTLMPEVRDYEPRMALDGDEDGLCFYRRIAAESGAFLLPGGAVYVEIGCDQAEEVSELFRTAGFSKIRVIRDLTGRDRVVRARLH